MKLTQSKRAGFHLQIDSLEEFSALVAVIRGEQDAGKIRELTAQITGSTTNLADAIRRASAPQPTPKGRVKP